MVPLSPRTISVSALSLIALLSLFSISAIGCQKAFACQCARLLPAENYGRSDVIFVGEVTGIEKDRPLDNGNYVTFNVSKAWKGVDAKIVTIRTGHGQDCSYYRFEEGEEYLVFGNKNLLEIDVRLCGGTEFTSYGDFEEKDLGYLEANFDPIPLSTSRITSFDIFPSLQIVSFFLVISAAAFVILVKRG